LAGQRRNLNALPAASLKFPPVIAALQSLPIKPPVRKWNSPVRARIAHRERFAFYRAPQNQRHFQQHRRLQLVAGNFRASQSRIPEIPKKSGIAFGRSFPFLKCTLQNWSHRFAHSLFPPRRIVVYLANIRQSRGSSFAQISPKNSNQAGSVVPKSTSTPQEANPIAPLPSRSGPREFA
jgi:hypothetical protein